MIDWEKIKSALIEKGRIESNTELAQILGVSQPAASKWLSGKSEPSPETKLRACDLLGYQWARQAILALFPKEKADQIIKWNNSVTKKWNQRSDQQKKRREVVAEYPPGRGAR